MPLDYESASQLLRAAFDNAEKLIADGKTPSLDDALQPHLDKLFQTTTQAFREGLIGCILAKAVDKNIDVHLPYVKQGQNAYNGRELDQSVINPFLKDKQIPSSKNPFLSMFRRNFKFDDSGLGAVRDPETYRSFVALVNDVDATTDDNHLIVLLLALLAKFIQLREESVVNLSKIQRLSLKQIGTLTGKLLTAQSGGRFPVLMVVATLQALNERLTLGWEIQFQGINVADSAGGEPGDITVKHNGKVVLAAEVTERTVDKNRVVSTFRTKIAPLGVQDYLFFSKADDEAQAQAHQYFAQGHEVNFIHIQSWMSDLLATLGIKGRQLFLQHFIALMEDPDIPKAMKVAWNDAVLVITS